MTFSIDDLINIKRQELDCLVTCRNIQRANNCNLCNNMETCKYAPKQGELNRFNCPLFNLPQEEENVEVEGDDAE